MSVITRSAQSRYESTRGESNEEEKKEMKTLEQELRCLLNHHSAENESDTPDFILARYLLSCLSAWNTATQQRETWHGRDASPSGAGKVPVAREGIEDMVPRSRLNAIEIELEKSDTKLIRMGEIYRSELQRLENECKQLKRTKP